MSVSKNPIYGVVIIKYKKLFENNNPYNNQLQMDT